MSAQPVVTEATILPSRYQAPEACALVIFGASGDLTRRKLLPALYALAHDGLLPEHFSVIGFARREKGHDAFREEMRAAVDEYSRLRPVKPDAWERLARHLYYVAAAFEDPKGYEALKKLLADVDRRAGTGGNRVFYLATPPSAYSTVVAQLGAAGLVSENWNGGSEAPGGAGGAGAASSSRSHSGATSPRLWP